jgi:hypothetical protein
MSISSQYDLLKTLANFNKAHREFGPAVSDALFVFSTSWGWLLIGSGTYDGDFVSTDLPLPQKPGSEHNFHRTKALAFCFT